MTVNAATDKHLKVFKISIQLPLRIDSAWNKFFKVIFDVQQK